MSVIIVLFLIIVVTFIVVRGNITRGKRFVNAYIFIDWLEKGHSAEDANNIARLFGGPHADPDLDSREIQRAKAFSAQNFGGKQLPVIQAAIEKGFKG